MEENAGYRFYYSDLHPFHPSTEDFDQYAFFCFVAPAMEAKGTCALQGKKMALEAGARSRCSAAPDGLLRCGKANGSQALSRAGAGPASRAISDIISGRQKKKKNREKHSRLYLPPCSGDRCSVISASRHPHS